MVLDLDLQLCLLSTLYYASLWPWSIATSIELLASVYYLNGILVASFAQSHIQYTWRFLSLTVGSDIRFDHLGFASGSITVDVGAGCIG